jgi:hypothetical protein
MGERLCIGDWVHINGIEGIFLRMEDKESLCVKPNDPVELHTRGVPIYAEKHNCFPS